MKKQNKEHILTSVSVYDPVSNTSGSFAITYSSIENTSCYTKKYFRLTTNEVYKDFMSIPPELYFKNLDTETVHLELKADEENEKIIAQLVNNVNEVKCSIEYDAMECANMIAKDLSKDNYFHNPEDFMKIPFYNKIFEELKEKYDKNSDGKNKTYLDIRTPCKGLATMTDISNPFGIIHHVTFNSETQSVCLEYVSFDDNEAREKKPTFYLKINGATFILKTNAVLDAHKTEANTTLTVRGKLDISDVNAGIPDNIPEYKDSDSVSEILDYLEKFYSKFKEDNDFDIF